VPVNDPHVKTLHYRIKHSDSTDFERAPPLEHAEKDFSIRIEAGRAMVEMSTHHATPESARAIVEPFLRVWELEAALFNANDNFEFAFERCEVIRSSVRRHCLRTVTLY
jgi:hypothetical protein